MCVFNIVYMEHFFSSYIEFTIIPIPNSPVSNHRQPLPITLPVNQHIRHRGNVLHTGFYYTALHCKSLVNFFKFNENVLSALGTIKSVDAYFSGTSVDSRSCKVLKK